MNLPSTLCAESVLHKKNCLALPYKVLTQGNCIQATLFSFLSVNAENQQPSSFLYWIKSPEGCEWNTNAVQCD